jgi:hypothetical protein
MKIDFYPAFVHNNHMSASFENPTADLLMYRSATKLIFLSPAEIIANGKFKNLTDYLESISKPGKLPNRKALQPSQIKHLQILPCASWGQMLPGFTGNIPAKASNLWKMQMPSGVSKPAWPKYFQKEKILRLP